MIYIYIYDLSEIGCERLKNVLVTRDCETPFVIKAKLFSRLMEKDLELRVSEEGDRNNVSASVLSNIHNKVTLRHVQRKPFFIISLFLS